MVESAKPRFKQSDLGHLRGLIRLAVEFHDYLEHGERRVSYKLLEGPYAKYITDVQSPARTHSTSMIWNSHVSQFAPA